MSAVNQVQERRTSLDLLMTLLPEWKLILGLGVLFFSATSLWMFLSGYVRYEATAIFVIGLRSGTPNRSLDDIFLLSRLIDTRYGDYGSIKVKTRTYPQDFDQTKRQTLEVDISGKSPEQVAEMARAIEGFVVERSAVHASIYSPVQIQEEARAIKEVVAVQEELEKVMPPGLPLSPRMRAIRDNIASSLEAERASHEARLEQAGATNDPNAWLVPTRAVLVPSADSVRDVTGRPRILLGMLFLGMLIGTVLSLVARGWWSSATVELPAVESSGGSDAISTN